ncbi:MAG TPA: hypothetical protein VGR31_11125 [Planctomycetota bacterium]|jgi:hypothetical protein|nr:hypothetical protein [Planctomycetota bacterium]
MNWIQFAARSAACVVLAAAPVLASEPAPRALAVSSTTVSVSTNEVGTGWVVDRADNICGLDDPKMLSKPAKLDYDTLLRATPEMKKVKDDKIEPNSPQGIQLRQAAATRVQTAADKVRAADGYCSVWKTIKHTDGRAIPDITEAVKALL